jgi:hypothetical protein
MSPTIAECLEHARQCDGTQPGPTMKRTANSFVEWQGIGPSWPLLQNKRFGPLRVRLPE